MSFYYLNQNTTTSDSPFEYNFNIENFESMPPIDTINTDGNYQCSDNVQISGNTIGSIIPNSTLYNCKTQCRTDDSCIGFDFDKSNSSCTLRNTITDLTSTKQNNVMCVKKTSSACKVSPQTNPQEAAQQIIGAIEQENPVIPGVPMPLPPESTITASSSSSSGSPGSPGSPGYTGFHSYNRKSLPTMPTPPETMNNKSSCKSDTIYVDLPCFLNKMDVLKNHSDNLMIDLQLLITNLKSCSYVKKPTKPRTTNTNNPFKPINGDSFDDELDINGNFNISGSKTSNTVSNSNIPITMPTQDTIKIYNSPASVLYTNNPNTNANVMLGISEPFQNSEQQSSTTSTSFFESFTFIVIVIVCIFILLITMNNK
jgi:hypothetical protein